MLVLILVLAACASGTTATTADEAVTTSEAPATTVAPDTTEDDSDNGSVSSLSDMPQECLDAFDAYLQEIEPVVSEFDFQNATQADFNELSIEIDAIEAPMEEMTADCPELDMAAEDSIDAMIDYANSVAPGTVPYFEYIASFVGASSVGTGDCEADIASLMEFVDSGGTMNELTLTEVAEVSGLLQSVSTACSAERFAEFIGQPEVSEFLGG